MRDAAAEARQQAAAEAKATPFLTDEQRAALDVALREKAQEQAKARAAANHKAAQASGERKSRSGKGPGGAKKGGGGGKYTWGSLLTRAGSGDANALDRHDPNYDSEEDDKDVVLLRNAQSAMRQEVALYKEEVRSIVEEYFASGSIDDVADSLEELGGVGHLAHYFVKRLVTAALDRKDREREMASTLLSSLYAEVIPPEQVQKGFSSLISSIGDLVLDVPDAPELLSRFVLRAIVDDVLPPAVVTHIDAESSPAAKDLRHRCESQLAARHSAEKVLRCWGGAGTGISYSDTKAAIRSLLDEFLSSHDEAEAARRLRELAVPFFHHELVKQALVSAMDNPAHTDAVVALLARLSSTGEVSVSQLARGRRRVADNLPDAVLDNPAAGERYAEVMAAARKANIFDESEGAAEAPAAASNGAAAAAAGPANGAATPGTSNGGAATAAGDSLAVAMPPGLAAFKAASLAAVREYFDSQDASEVAARLTALDEPGLHHLFVKAAVSLSLDRKDRERELVSKLLVALCPQVITHDQLASGFTRLLSSADDLLLDVPDALRLLSLFLGRAVVDELLPPAFLTQVLPALDAEGVGVSVVRSAGVMLGARHGTERLVNCWHGGALEVGAIRQQIRDAIQEYGTSGDVAEVARCLGDLDAPAYNHEAVVAAIELAFNRYHGSSSSDAAAAGSSANGDAAGLEAAVGPTAVLLGALCGQGVVTATQLAKGVDRVQKALGDEVMDYGPSARAVLERLVARGEQEGWLSSA